MTNIRNRLSLMALTYNNFFKRNPLVLNIEFSHACNLKCLHCGRIRDNVKGKLNTEVVQKAIDETNTPIIYFTGGEPFLFVEDLSNAVNYALSKKKVVIIVTNGTLLETNLNRLNVPQKKNLILMFSVDGLQESHDRIRGQGSFEQMEKGIQKAQELGFENRWINFTLYSSNLADLENVVHYFKEKIDTFHFNMYFDFLGDTPTIHEKIRPIVQKVKALKKKYNNILNPYTYFDLWDGLNIDCTPWGTVTLDPSGWRSPCYFIEKTHYPTYQELMNETDWDFYAKKKADECRNCKAHCGFEPTIYRKKQLLLKEISTRVMEV